MPGPNTSGLPSTGDYLLGRGIVYVAALDPTTNKPVAWRDVGNCPEFTVTVESESLEHQSSREGLRLTDKEVVLSQDVSYSFALDEVNDENLALFFSGNKSSFTNPTVAGFTNSALTTSLELARWYDLETSGGVRAYDVEGTNLTVNRDPGGTPVALTEGVAGVGDYLVDVENGRIFFHESPNTGSLTNGDTIEVVLAADGGAAANVDEVQGLTATSVVVAIKFISENPADNNRKQEFQIQQTTIRAEGDFALISDDWTQMTFAGSTERNDSYPAGQQYFVARTIPAA